MKDTYNACVGSKINELDIIGVNIQNRKYQCMTFTCLCSCNETTILKCTDVIEGTVKNCGAKVHTDKEDKLLKRVKFTWDKLIHRYKNQLCFEWLQSFDRFYEDVGKPPSPSHTLRLQDSTKQWCKDNCEWVINQGEKSIKHAEFTFNGVTKTLKEWCDDYEQPYSLVYSRVYNLDWNIIDALECKKVGNKPKKIDRRRRKKED